MWLFFANKALHTILMEYPRSLAINSVYSTGIINNMSKPRSIHALDGKVALEAHLLLALSLILLLLNPVWQYPKRGVGSAVPDGIRGENHFLKPWSNLLQKTICPE